MWNNRRQFLSFLGITAMWLLTLPVAVEEGVPAWRRWLSESDVLYNMIGPWGPWAFALPITLTLAWVLYWYPPKWGLRAINQLRWRPLYPAPKQWMEEDTIEEVLSWMDYVNNVESTKFNRLRVSQNMSVILTGDHPPRINRETEEKCRIFKKKLIKSGVGLPFDDQPQDWCAFIERAKAHIEVDGLDAGRKFRKNWIETKKK